MTAESIPVSAGLREYTAYLTARTGEPVSAEQVIEYLLLRKNTLDDQRLAFTVTEGHITHQPLAGIALGERTAVQTLHDPLSGPSMRCDAEASLAALGWTPLGIQLAKGEDPPLDAEENNCFRHAGDGLGADND